MPVQLARLASFQANLSGLNRQWVDGAMPSGSGHRLPRVRGYRHRVMGSEFIELQAGHGQHGNHLGLRARTEGGESMAAW